MPNCSVVGYNAWRYNVRMVKPPVAPPECEGEEGKQAPSHAAAWAAC